MHSLLLLIVQIAVVLVAARLVGLAFRRIHQPQVVGEMVAGILLGPSLLGWAAPGVSAALFPAESLGALGTLSQVGLLLFMFLVGLELDPKLLRGRGHAAVVTSHVSIIVPFMLGAALALVLYPQLSDDTVGFTGFALFLGAAMSVTAFPVLARILAERNLMRTKVGAVTIACAAVDDVTAWCILAIVVAVVRAPGAHLPVWAMVLGSGLFVAAMLVVVRPGLRRLEAFYHSRGGLTQDMTAVVLLLLLASAFTTEWLGIHALFGAFALGAVMPKGRAFRHELTDKLEHVTVVFLLPLFFAFAGLRTSVGLVSGAEMWLFCGLILLVAVAGKFGGSTIAARLTGLSWREAGALGVLMNTRGLMELVILTIGLELGIISPALFTMMVIMALVTTFMTTPVLAWLYPDRLLQQEAETDGGVEREYAVLVPVALPSSGPGLLRAAAAVSPVPNPEVYALHLRRAADQSLTRVGSTGPAAEREALAPLLEAAAETAADVHPLSFVSRDPGGDIREVAHAKAVDLVLMGWHKPVLSRSVLSGTVAQVLSHARADVVVYLERTTGPWRRVLVPYQGGIHDRRALEIAGRLAQRHDAEVTLLHVVAPESADREGLRTIAGSFEGVHLRVVGSDAPLDVAVAVAQEGFDLALVGLSETWGLDSSPFSTRHERLVDETDASVLIVRAYEASPLPVRPVPGPGALLPA